MNASRAADAAPITYSLGARFGTPDSLGVVSSQAVAALQSAGWLRRRWSTTLSELLYADLTAAGLRELDIDGLYAWRTLGHWPRTSRLAGLIGAALDRLIDPQRQLTDPNNGAG